MAKRNEQKPEDEGSFFGDNSEICPVCKQEYTGFCPINSNRCPYADDAEEEDEEDSDFEDVENLDAVLGSDAEADRMVEESEEGLDFGAAGEEK